MTTDRKIRNLIERADLAHGEGDIDQEIEYRLRAFVLSEDLSPRPVEGIEKAAHLICDIGEELADTFENLPAARKEQKVVCEQLSNHPWHAAPVRCDTVIVPVAAREMAIQMMPEAGIVLSST